MSNMLYPALAGLSFDSTKTPLFNNIVQRSVSMAELRGSFASTPVYDIVLAYDLLRDDATHNELKTLMGFFMARQGSWDSFLYQDPDDNVASSTYFGTGDGATQVFQLTRPYGSFTESVSNFSADATVSNGAPATLGAAAIYVNFVLMTVGTDYTVSSTGLVTFTVAPPFGYSLNWTGIYYYRSRFAIENNPFTLQQFMSKLWEAQQVEFYGSLGTKI